ncbi:hypothetical protein E2C01_096355 [Portunus trituberculatus]|uniref:Uncharacterized protein n=1 Tax=Portunus trituberculatus TaxID=210409 RepID=A0A5B7JSE4_PORTR|nr:hypothetical protein [Portunus trituberculatus]
MWVKKKCPSQPISCSNRYKFVVMWLQGMSARSIARQHGVSPSTVCRWINHWKHYGRLYGSQYEYTWNFQHYRSTSCLRMAECRADCLVCRAAAEALTTTLTSLVIISGNCYMGL